MVSTDRGLDANLIVPLSVFLYGEANETFLYGEANKIK